MTDRPIIFRAPMVRALLDGRKSQHRVPLKPQPGVVPFIGGVAVLCCEDGYAVAGQTKPQPMPYAVGDRLWVREVWRIGAWDFENDTMCVDFRADAYADTTPRHVDDSDWFENAWRGVSDELRGKGTHPDAAGVYQWDVGCSPLRWRSPVAMPRWASRLTLIVTDVRVTRLQDISEADALAEGSFLGRCQCADMQDKPGSASEALFKQTWCHLHGDEFRAIWNSHHGPDAWAANPWVAALTFTTHRQNIDQMEPTNEN